MNDIAEALKERTMRFAVRVVRFCRGLPDTWEGRHVRDQLFRAGTGTAANYHAACRAPSHRDFISKIGVVVEESDESVFWLKFVGEVGLSDAGEREQLFEGSERTAGDLHSIGKDRQRKPLLKRNHDLQ